MEVTVKKADPEQIKKWVSLWKRQDAMDERIMKAGKKHRQLPELTEFTHRETEGENAPP